MASETIKVEGMSCSHCEKAVENSLSGIGAAVVKADASKNEVYVEFDPAKLTLAEIKNEITETGYRVRCKNCI